MSDWQNPPVAHRMQIRTEDCPDGYDVLRYGDSVGVRCPTWAGSFQLGYVIDNSDDWDGSGLTATLRDRTPLGPCRHWMEGVEMIIRNHEAQGAGA